MKENYSGKFAESLSNRASEGDLWRAQMNATQNAVSLVTLAVSLISLPVLGQTLSTTYITLSPGLDVTGTWDSGANVNSYPAGQLQFAHFDAFCVEPGVNVGSGLLVYDIQSPGSLANFNTVSRLVGGYLATPSRTDEVAAAFQWAIYEVVAENVLPWNLLDGNVNISTPISASVATLANGYLANEGSFPLAQITYLTHPTRQNVVAWNVIPEPSTAGLAVLSGLLLFRRRRA